MNLISRTVLFLKRRVRSRIYGITFRGTSAPDSLVAVRLAGKVRTVLLPENSGHWHDFINIFLDDEYGLQKLATAPKTILDLGGNVGLFSLYARDCFGDAQIHCYEPNPELIPFLRANLDGLDIQVYDMAVGIRSGACNLETTSDNRCSAISAGEGNIKIESFENVIARFDTTIDLLKIDIEGGEWPLLFDTDSPAFQKVDRIAMEYHTTESHSFADLEEASKRLGFLIEHHSKNSGFGIVWLSRIALRRS